MDQTGKRVICSSMTVSVVENPFDNVKESDLQKPYKRVES